MVPQNATRHWTNMLPILTEVIYIWLFDVFIMYFPLFYNWLFKYWLCLRANIFHFEIKYLIILRYLDVLVCFSFERNFVLRPWQGSITTIKGTPVIQGIWLTNNFPLTKGKVCYVCICFTLYTWHTIKCTHLNVNVF